MHIIVTKRIVSESYYFDRTAFGSKNLRVCTYFWSTGYAWGTCKVAGQKADLEVLSGSVELTSLTLAGLGTAKIKPVRLSADSAATLHAEVR